MLGVCCAFVPSCLQCILPSRCKGMLTFKAMRLRFSLRVRGFLFADVFFEELDSGAVMFCCAYKGVA